MDFSVSSNAYWFFFYYQINDKLALGSFFLLFKPFRYFSICWAKLQPFTARLILPLSFLWDDQDSNSWPLALDRTCTSAFDRSAVSYCQVLLKNKIFGVLPWFGYHYLISFFIPPNKQRWQRLDLTTYRFGDFCLNL